METSSRLSSGEELLHPRSSLELRIQDQVQEGIEVKCFKPVLNWKPQVRKYFEEAYGKEHFSNMCNALCRPPLSACLRINTLHHSTAQVIDTLKSIFKLDGESESIQGQAGDLGHTNPIPASRYHIHEHESLKDVVIIRGFQTRDLNPKEKSKSSDPNTVQGTVLQESDNFQEQKNPESCVVFGQANGSKTNQITGSGKEVIVSRKCAEAVLRGSNVFIPGVLACSANLEEGDVVHVLAAIESLDENGEWSYKITRGTVLGTEHSIPYLQSPDRNNWLIGRGRSCFSRVNLFKRTEGVAIEMTDRIFDLPPCHGILSDAIFLQNLPSIVTARVLGPRPGETILDMCAAPGGKTTAIAILMQNIGQVYALDRSHKKVDEIKRLAEEMGITIIKAYKMDALKCVIAKNSDNKREGSTVDVKSVDDEYSSKLVSAQSNKQRNLKAENEEQIIPEFAKLLHGKDISTYEENESCREKGEGIKEKTEKGGEYELEEEKDKGDSEKHKQFTSADEVNTPTQNTNEKDNSYKSKREERKRIRQERNGKEKNKLYLRNQSFLGFHERSFEKILLDAPCSALGLRPRLFASQVDLEDLRKHALYQKRLFDVAIRLLKPNGIIVYSTCSINPGENEAIVRYALDKYPNLRLIPQEPRLGGQGLVGGESVFDGKTHREWLHQGEEKLVQRFDPCDSNDSIGFFIAKFQMVSH